MISIAFEIDASEINKNKKALTSNLFIRVNIVRHYSEQHYYHSVHQQLIFFH